MSHAYHITQWHPLYERADTRKTDYMSWYPKQTKMIGRGIGKTMKQPFPENMVLMGLWNQIEVLASLSKVDQRGWLIRDGQALDAEGMSDLMPTIQAEAFQKAIDWFSQPTVGWLKLEECPFLTGNSPAKREPAGKFSHSSPAQREPAGKNSAIERETEREFTDRRETEREALTLAAARASAPSPKEVETWAESSEIPVAFALEKLAEGIERGDFAKKSVRENWQPRFARFWKDDAPAWNRKNQKNGAPKNRASGVHPDGWKDGDQQFWWTDSLAELRATMAGAAMTDKKSAARIGEIIKQRERKH